MAPCTGEIQLVFFCQVRWRPWARTGPAAANVVSTHGSAGIHAFSVPPLQGPFQFFWTAHGTHHTYPLGMLLPHMQNHCLFQRFPRICLIRVVKHTFRSQRLVFVARCAESLLFPRFYMNLTSSGGGFFSDKLISLLTGVPNHCFFQRFPRFC